jgi:hypothetical protein
LKTKKKTAKADKKEGGKKEKCKTFLFNSEKEIET